MRTIIYILSNGRSGSTILEMALGRTGGIYNVGELQLLCLEGKQNKMPCGCGRPVKSCDFWQEVRGKQSDSRNDSLLGFLRNTERHGHGKTIRLNLLINSITNSSKRYEQYIEYNEELLNILFQTTGNKVIVDSSKDPYRLFLIKNLPNINFVVVSIKKKLIPYIYSTTNFRGGVFAILRVTLRYYFNFFFMCYLTSRFFSKTTVNIEYSKFVVEPIKYINKVRSHCGLGEIDELSDISSRTHAISGNRTRHKSKILELDERWKSNLPKHLRFLAKW